MSDTRQAWAIGGAVFAATMMVVVGIFQILQGIAAIIEDNFFILGPNYAYEVDTTAWGWIHLAIGAVLVLAGLALYTGATWARVVAIGVLAISAVANFLFIPYYPLWTLLIIALDAFLIWAIANEGRRVDLGAYDQTSAGRGMYAGEAGRMQQERWPASNQPPGRDWEREPAREATTGATAADEQARLASEQAAEQARRQARR